MSDRRPASRLSSRRFTESVALAMLRAGSRADAQAEAALHVIATALRVDAALRIVAARTDRPYIFGNPDVVDELNPGADCTRYSVVQDLGGCGILTLAIRRGDRRVIGGHDRRLLAQATRVLAAWAISYLVESAALVERRAMNEPFDAQLERAARHAVADGASASVVLIHTGQDDVVARRLAKRIRTNLRATELAGTVGAGDIGMLLYGVAPEQIPAVLGRMRRLVEEDIGTDPVAIGVAHRSAGDVWVDRLVASAREDAWRNLKTAG